MSVKIINSTPRQRQQMLYDFIVTHPDKHYQTHLFSERNSLGNLVTDDDDTMTILKKDVEPDAACIVGWAMYLFRELNTEWHFYPREVFDILGFHEDNYKFFYREVFHQFDNAKALQNFKHLMESNYELQEDSK